MMLMVGDSLVWMPKSSVCEFINEGWENNYARWEARATPSLRKSRSWCLLKNKSSEFLEVKPEIHQDLRNPEDCMSNSRISFRDRFPPSRRHHRPAMRAARVARLDTTSFRWR